MIEYTPKELEGNVNVSSISPIKDLFVLLAGLLGLILFIYILLGIIVDIAAPYIPAKFENSLGNLYKASISNKKPSFEIQDQELQIQKILKKFEPYCTRKDLKFTVQVINKKTVNALAYPGGHIVIYNELFNQSKSENEIAFVLAHELGHYADHDHLRAAGRGLIFVLASVALFGSESQISQFISELLSVTHMKFSQKQELKADFYALNLLQKAYGNVDGAVEFMSQMNSADKHDEFTYFFATHPYPKTRLQLLKNEIQLRGYSLGKGVSENLLPNSWMSPPNPLDKGSSESALTTDRFSDAPLSNQSQNNQSLGAKIKETKINIPNKE